MGNKEELPQKIAAVGEMFMELKKRKKKVLKRRLACVALS